MSQCLPNQPSDPHICLKETVYRGVAISIHYLLTSKRHDRSSCCGTTGSEASLQCQHAGSIPGQALIRHCCSCGVGHNCGSDLILGPETPHAQGWQKKKQKQKPEMIAILHWDWLKMKKAKMAYLWASWTPESRFHFYFGSCSSRSAPPEVTLYLY